MKDAISNRVNAGPLAGIRVVEFCNTFAGPACCRLLADFGADVIKVEPLDGDPVRQMGHYAEGVSLQGTSIQRGKRSLAVDLKTAQGKKILAELIDKADVLVENNRPGVMERLGFSYDKLKQTNPALVMVRISGYGQDGPYSKRPGYGAICDAFASIRWLTGDPDRPPSRVALATTDYLTAVYGAFGAMLALFHRKDTGVGQLVDAALYEAAFSMMEGFVPAYDKLQYVPMRQGPNLPNVAPNSLYRTSDGYVLIAANNDATFTRLAEALSQPGLVTDDKFCNVRLRGENAAELDAIVNEWTAQHTGADVERKLIEASVPVSRVFTIADVFEDPHFKAREMLLDVEHPTLGKIKQTGIVPKLSETPGSVRFCGPEVGADSAAVLAKELNYSAHEIQGLFDKSVIG